MRLKAVQFLKYDFLLRNKFDDMFLKNLCIKLKNLCCWLAGGALGPALPCLTPFSLQT